MAHKLKNLISNLFDSSGNETYAIFYVIVAVVTIVISKIMGFENIIVILICGTVVVTLGLIFQVLRKDKNIKNLLFYLFGSIFVAFVTYMVYLMNKYYTQNNINMAINIIKVFIGGIALLIDIVGIVFLSNQINSRMKKIILIVMIYMSLIALAAILFLPPKIAQ